jgi:hypothetical protein
MFILLLPWLPVAVWCMVFLFGDPIPRDITHFIIGKVIPSFVLVYPIFLVHGVGSSWLAHKRNRSPSVVLIKALYPLLLIIPVSLLVVAFATQ